MTVSAQEKQPVKQKKLDVLVTKVKHRAEMAQNLLTRAEILQVEQPGFIQPENDLEKTYKLSQDQLRQHVDLNTKNKIFDLDLAEHGPYRFKYSYNGRHLLLAGRKGHVAWCDWQKGKLVGELLLGETIRDACWLQNESMFAVAQEKYVYIYDKTGAEIHCLKKHAGVNRLDYLPHHFLLVSVNDTGYLKYQDTTTGAIVAELKTRLGNCQAMTKNPYNATIHLGHGNGTVTLWKPTSPQPLVKILCHKGPILSIAVEDNGNVMATSGLDGQLKIWDIRKYQPIHSYYSPKPAICLNFSQQGLLATGYTNNVTIWKDIWKEKQKDPYMSEVLDPKSQLEQLQFCPFEDVLGCGHTVGFSSLVIPGAGEAQFDSFSANPFQLKKQRREQEVKMLLEKVKPEMIQLDPAFIGGLDQTSQVARLKEMYQEEMENLGEKKKQELKKKMRGRNSASKRVAKRKMKNVIDQVKLKAIEDQVNRKKAASKPKKTATDEEGALKEFYQKNAKKPKTF